MDEWWGRFSVGKEVQLWLIIRPFNTVFHHCRVVHGKYRPFHPDIHRWKGSDHGDDAIMVEPIIRKCLVRSVLFTCPLMTQRCPLFPLILWSFLKDATVTKSKKKLIRVQWVLSSPPLKCWESGGMGSKDAWTIQPLEEPKQMRLGLHLSRPTLSYCWSWPEPAHIREPHTGSIAFNYY